MVTTGKLKKRKRGFWRQLALLLWKSFLVRRRHWFLTILEIILPALLFSVLLYLRLMPQSTFIPIYKNGTYSGQLDDERMLKAYLCQKHGTWAAFFCASTTKALKLFYGPPNNFTRNLALHIATELDLPATTLESVKSNDAMNEAVKQLYITYKDSPLKLFVGIFVDGMENDEVPVNFKYSIRLRNFWSTGKQYFTKQVPGPRAPNRIPYRTDGFVLIQTLIDRYYISQLTNDDSYMKKFEIFVQDYPYPPYYSDNGASLLFGSIIPVFLMLSLILLSPTLIKSIVHEKETGVRELVCLMGTNRWLVWLGWLLHSLLSIIIIVTIITIILTVGMHKNGYIPPIIANTDPSFLWVLLLLYGISSICFCLFVTTFFSKPTLATTVGILLWLLTYFIPNGFMYQNYDNYGLAPKLLSCLLPNMASAWSFRIIQMFEGRGVALGWHNLWATGHPRDTLSIAMILLMFALDTFLFLFLTWYIDQVNPGIYGVPLPWYFPFQKSYWCGHRAKEFVSHDHLDDESRKYFEDEPIGLKAGIVIKNLRKEFKTFGGKTKVAVENVSMTCYEGQCTVLLGHNGAGKTTTMSVLTGVYAPSGGSARVGDWDIATNLQEAREELGLCPQHNMLFVDLTVLQHLLFFGRLKGLTTSQAKKEALQILGKLDLLEKQNVFGNQLSGGMKRKLCLAISLVGGSKVVILDEPSSGLDPESRRWVWNVVQGERGSRTFLITTHHMEEADVLGDRVAIMASGRVVCAGSSLFLKNQFGDGYTLEMIVSDGVRVHDLTRRVQRHLPAATLQSFHSGEITFKLPPTTKKFASLLEDISNNKAKLGVCHIGLSLTTMERVFLRVCEVMEKTKIAQEEANNMGYYNESFISDSTTGNSTNDDKTLGLDNCSRMHGRGEHPTLEISMRDFNRLSGISLACQRLKALFIKRIIYTKRKWPLLITQILLPVIVTVLCIVVDRYLSTTTEPEKPLALGLDLYKSKTYSYVAQSTGSGDLALWYKSLFIARHQVFDTTNMTESLLKAADENLPIYRENNIASAEFSLNAGFNQMRILAQTIPIHAMGVATTLVDNALLRYATNSSNNSITTINYPLPSDKTNLVTETFSVSTLVYATMMPIALSLLSASFLVFILQERMSKAKQVQVMTGAPVWMLWIVSFIWDYLAYIVSAILIFILFVAINPNKYFSPMNAKGALFLLLFMYGWASIPMAYVFSFPFQTSASGFSILALINIVTGMILSTVVLVFDLSEDPDLKRVSVVIYWISSLVPAYPASTGFRHLIETSKNNTRCDPFGTKAMQKLCEIMSIAQPTNIFLECCPQCRNLSNIDCFEKKTYLEFGKSGMATDFLTLLVNGLIFICIIFFIEKGLGRAVRRYWMRLRCRIVSPVSNLAMQNKSIDDDVAAENNLINAMLNGSSTGDERSDISREVSSTALLAYGLTKEYFGSAFRAVDNISFRVRRGECLGLLGVNGAGKTTTFSMLTGDEPPTDGDAVINGVYLTQNKSKFVQNIGFCPQFDALIGEFTGKEMLILLGRLRGIRDSSLKQEARDLIKLVDLTECAERPCSTYSGGNKRKLSTAMALVGSPSLVFLDEPTSGVDPASRRRVWTAVSQAITNGQSVILTSHSMEECEALCSRIIIMSKGTLRCMGTSTHLKAKFGQGYSLQIKLKVQDLFQDSASGEDNLSYDLKVRELKSLINKYLPGAIISDQHKGMLSYHVPTSISWGQLFSTMESLKAGEIPSYENERKDVISFAHHIVEDYAASDTSLEQVFLSFAREGNSTSSEVPKTSTADKLIQIIS